MMHPVAAAYMRLLYYGWNPEDPAHAVISANARALLQALGVDVAQMREVARAHMDACLSQPAVKH